VKDVAPALETNYSGIKEVLESLVKNYKGKEEEFGAFQREYGIQVSRAGVEYLAQASHVGQC
jgi:prefoldin subunit 2